MIRVTCPDRHTLVARTHRLRRSRTGCTTLQLGHAPLAYGADAGLSAGAVLYFQRALRRTAYFSAHTKIPGARVMIIGMSLSTFTTFHVVLSLIGILSGVIVVFGMLSSLQPSALTALFLLTTVATSVTGFMFPSTGFDAADRVGVISLAVLAVTILALYAYHLAGAWRWIYVAGAVIALYLNVFVGVVQAFQKLPFLHPLAPTGSESPFIVAQVLVMAIFVILGILAAKRFHPAMHASA